VVLEAKTFPRHKPCGGGLTRSALQAYAALELRPDLPLTAVSALEVRSSRRTHTFARERPYFVVADRVRLDAWLAREACAAGVRLIEGARVKAISRTAGQFRVETSQGEFSSRFVIGADGAASIVRREFCQPGKRLARLIEVRADIGPDARTAVFDFSHVKRGLDGYAWTFPFYDDSRRLMANVGVFDSGLHGSGRRESLPTLVAEHLGLESWSEVRARFETSSHPLRRWDGVPDFQAGVLLVGDALGADPLLGEGISTALHHGLAAGEALARHRRDPAEAARAYRRALVSAEHVRVVDRRRRFARVVYGTGGHHAIAIGLRVASRLDPGRLGR
jgi:flavin-dependent dehydrogenase